MFKSVEKAIDDLRAGKVIIVVDDESRENEGDFVAAAETCTPETMNFLIREGRGMICAPITEERAKELELDMMVSVNTSLHETPFTVLVDYRHGTTTGISTSDRAATIRALADPNAKASDFARPGHIAPLRSVEEGVLRRAGHTEAVIDLVTLAGMYPAGVLCEILNEDGTMARMPQLEKIAERHGLTIVTIADLIRYRVAREKLVRKVVEVNLPTEYGDFRLHLYHNVIDGKEHMALVKGDIHTPEPVLVRVHQHNLLADSLGDVTPGEFFRGERRPRDRDLQNSMRAIARAGRGVIVLIREPTATTIGRMVLEREGHPMSKPMDELRQYGIGAQILMDIGVKNMILLSHATHKMIGIEGYGITIVEQRPIPDMPD